MPILERGRFNTVPGTTYGTPKELWGFRWRAPRLAPVAIAVRFLRGEEERLGLPGIVFADKPRVVEGLGATHVILQQRHRRLPIHRAYVTVHISRDRHVYLVKNRAVPVSSLVEKGTFRLSPTQAIRRARERLGANPVTLLDPPEKRWFLKGENLRPAYRLRLQRRVPPEEWITYVNADTGGILSHYDNLAFGWPIVDVFDPNPVTAVTDWRTLRTPGGSARKPPRATYVAARLRGLGKSLRLNGSRVTTFPTPRRVSRAALPLDYVSNRSGFLEIMAYFHLDRVMRYLESLGYRGPRALFPRPLPVNAHGTRSNNSSYSPWERAVTFGIGGIPDASDAEVILHEFGHAVQDAICPDFGQSMQAAAMGEGFGDYLAASFFAAVKPPALRDCVMSWDNLEESEDDPPCLRRMDDSLTFESFDHEGDEHDNGPIWAATLWDVWNAVGRDIADTIILDSHFQLDGFTTFARGARAIIDADRNLYRGRHGAILRRIFRRRGIGPVE